MKRKSRNKLTVDPPAPSNGTGNAALRRAGKSQLTNGRRTSMFHVLALMFIFVACTNSDSAHEHDTYTCPMHPTVVSDRPGTCPVCGMDLVRKARPGDAVEITEDLARLLKSPNQTVVASVRTIKGQYKSAPVTVSASGVVTYDTRKIYTIPARIAGRLEKVYLKYEFQPVSKGQKIAEIYSPELMTAQRELIFLLENDSENTPLINAATTKLKLLGMTKGQITQLAQKKEASSTIMVYSAHSGYLITEQPAPSASVAAGSAQPSAGAMSDGMGATAPISQPQGQESSNMRIVRDGDYVTAGQTLFTLVDTNALRIELSLPGNYSGGIRVGSKVEVNLGHGQTEAATVDFIQPFYDAGQEFMKIRIYTNRTEGLRAGQLVNATLMLDSKESLWIPKEAILDLGMQKIVFLKDRGVLKPKEVTTGVTSGGLIEIKGGLASSEEIAANAQFLVDSESFIKPVN